MSTTSISELDAYLRENSRAERRKDLANIKSSTVKTKEEDIIDIETDVGPITHVSNSTKSTKSNPAAELNFITVAVYPLTCSNSNCHYYWQYQPRNKETYKKIASGLKQFTLCPACRTQCRIKKGPA